MDPSRIPRHIPESPGLAEGAWKDTIVLPFNHPAAFDKILRYADRLAGVIIEPVQGAAGTIPADREFLIRAAQDHPARSGPSSSLTK